MSQRPAVPPSGPVVSTGPEEVFTPSFLLASLVTLSSFSSFYLLLATLPVYLIQIGGTEAEVGLVIGSFSVLAVLLRPFVGAEADRRGKRPFMLAGTALMAVCSGIYSLATTIPLLMGLRVVHSVGWASFGTSTSALVADLAPRRQRGAAMGYYGMFSNLAMAVGPALGVMLMTGFGFPVLFAASAALSGVAVLLAIPIWEPARSGPPGRSAMSLGDVIERTALFPALVLALTAVTYGAIVSFLPLYAGKHQIGNPGVFFTVYAITLIVSRGFTGQLSDRYGRGAVIAPGLVLAAVALWVLAFTTTLAGFLLVAVLYGLAFAAIQPALMALVVDRAPPGRRGAAMGTFSSAMDLGIGGGSFVWGAVAQLAGYEAMYLAAGAVALAALAAFLVGSRK